MNTHTSAHMHTYTYLYCEYIFWVNGQMQLRMCSIQSLSFCFVMRTWLLISNHRKLSLIQNINISYLCQSYNCNVSENCCSLDITIHVIWRAAKGSSQWILGDGKTQKYSLWVTVFFLTRICQEWYPCFISKLSMWWY